MAYINVDEVYILDNTGRQVDKTTDLPFRDASLSETEKAQARANIGAGSTNPNLLDNPWFTVNQRGVNGTITNGQYGVDRWIAGSGTVTMATGGITLGAGNSYALQRPADPSIFNGKTVTLSVMTSDGTVESGTMVAQTGSAKTVRTANFELCIGYTAYNSFYFYNISSSAKTVIAAKLELGSVSTLANDVPPDYDKELDHCKWYFERIKAQTTYSSFGNGFGETTTHGQMQVPMHPKRTTNYTVSTSGSFTLYNGAQNSVVSALSKATSGLGQNVLCLVATATSLVQGSMYALIANKDASAYIDISADL